MSSVFSQRVEDKLRFKHLHYGDKDLLLHPIMRTHLPFGQFWCFTVKCLASGSSVVSRSFTCGHNSLTLDERLRVNKKESL